MNDCKRKPWRTAETSPLQLRTDAALAKVEHPMTAKSATETSKTCAANGWFSALRPLVQGAANDGSEPIASDAARRMNGLESRIAAVCHRKDGPSSTNALLAHGTQLYGCVYE